jgi:hypothetical protein
MPIMGSVDERSPTHRVWSLNLNLSLFENSVGDLEWFQGYTALRGQLKNNCMKALGDNKQRSGGGNCVLGRGRATSQYCVCGPGPGPASSISGFMA